VKVTPKFLKNVFFSSALVMTQITFAAEVALDKIIAIVDTDVVMQSEFDERLTLISEHMRNSGTPVPSRSEMTPQILEQLISERLQLDLAQRYGIRISDDAVNEAMRNIAKQQKLSYNDFVKISHDNGVDINTLRQQVFRQMAMRELQQGAVRSRINITDQEIDSFLKSEQGQFWKSPELELGHIILSLSAGANEAETAKVQTEADKLYQQLQAGADFRELATLHSNGQNALKGGDLGWRRSVQLPEVLSNAITGLAAGEVSKPVRSDAGFHILKVYQSRGGAQAAVILQHKARHILLKTNELRNDEACYEQLTEIRDRLQKGEEFAVLAKEYSEDYGSALGGGDLGWSMPGQFVAEFEQVISTVEIDEISYPFRTQFGWHILIVDERREQDFSGRVLRNQAAEILRDRKFGEELQIWLQGIRDKAYIEIKE
jgi:peptidyl-prolyl cis-trans isomerase SurA